jgi:hypothetical protein
MACFDKKKANNTGVFCVDFLLSAHLKKQTQSTSSSTIVDVTKAVLSMPATRLRPSAGLLDELDTADSPAHSLS